MASKRKPLLQDAEFQDSERQMSTESQISQRASHPSKSSPPSCSRCPLHIMPFDSFMGRAFFLFAVLVAFFIYRLCMAAPCDTILGIQESPWCYELSWPKQIKPFEVLLPIDEIANPCWYWFWVSFLSFLWIFLAPGGVPLRDAGHGAILSCILCSFWLLMMLCFLVILFGWVVAMVYFSYVLLHRVSMLDEPSDTNIRDHHLVYSWCVVLAVLTYKCSTTRLLRKICKDFKNNDRNVIPEKKYLCFFWIYWSLGLVAAACIVAADLPHAVLTQTNSMQLLRLVFCGLVMWRKVDKMETQTIEGSDNYTRTLGLNDDLWALYARPCVIMQWILLHSVSQHIWHGQISRMYATHYMIAALIMIIIQFYWMAGSAFCYRGTLHIHYFFWVVRRKNLRGNSPVDKRFLQVYIGLIAPSKLWDRFGLDERMQRRINDHCCMEWAASKGWKHFTMPQLMREEVDLFRYPAVNDIDSYTKLMIWAVKKMTVELGRLDPLFMDEASIEKPWAKQPIATMPLGIAGLKMATWDEQYSKKGKFYKTESSGTFERQLEILHWGFPAVDDPRWFHNELEGVMSYEAVVAPFAATRNTDWSDFTSDNAIEMMAFYGILQFMLEGRESDAFKRTCASEAFSLPNAPKPSELELLIDYSWIGNYKVRDRHARYGFIACFVRRSDYRSFKLSCIYVSHWKEWVMRPDAKHKDDRFDPSRKRWEHAKFVIKASVGTGVTLNEHLLQCHWIVANTASLALRQHLGSNHPIRRLMHVFVLRTASINFASTLTLLPEDRFVHRAAGFEYAGLGACLNDCARKFKYQTFPDVVKSMGLDRNLESQLPWVQDGKKLWNVIYRFVTVYVTTFYESDDKLYEDPELPEFWAMVANTPEGPPGFSSASGCSDGFGYGLPPLRADEDNTGIPARSRLIDYLTHVIFFVTANHEYYGALAEYFTSPMGLTTKLWDEKCDDNCLDECGQVMADIQTYMQSLCIVSATGYPQPRLMGKWDFLMHLVEDDGELILNDEQAANVKQYLGILNEHRSRNRYEVDASLKFDYNLQEPQQEDPGRQRNSGISPRNFTKLYEGDVDLNDVVKDRMSMKEQNRMLSHIHAAFMEELWRLDCAIQDENENAQKRKRPFEAFRPMNLECSVNI